MLNMSGERTELNRPLAEITSMLLVAEDEAHDDGENAVGGFAPQWGALPPMRLRKRPRLQRTLSDDECPRGARVQARDRTSPHTGAHPPFEPTPTSDDSLPRLLEVFLRAHADYLASIKTLTAAVGNGAPSSTVERASAFSAVLDTLQRRAFENAFMFTAQQCTVPTFLALRMRFMAAIIARNRERFPSAPGLTYEAIMHALRCCYWNLAQDANGYLHVLPIGGFAAADGRYFASTSGATEASNEAKTAHAHAAGGGV
jgi:hypothetical protein